MKRHRSKAPSQRQLRVGEELRHTLARILARGDMREPELHEVPITVTEVRASPDLKNVTAFVMPLGGGEEAAVVEALNRAAPYIRSQVAAEIALKYTPRLSFAVDNSFEEARRVDKLLRGVATKPAPAPAPDHEKGTQAQTTQARTTRARTAQARTTRARTGGRSRGA